MKGNWRATVTKWLVRTALAVGALALAMTEPFASALGLGVPARLGPLTADLAPQMFLVSAVLVGVAVVVAFTEGLGIRPRTLHVVVVNAEARPRRPYDGPFDPARCQCALKLRTEDGEVRQYRCDAASYRHAVPGSRATARVRGDRVESLRPMPDPPNLYLS